VKISNTVSAMRNLVVDFLHCNFVCEKERSGDTMLCKIVIDKLLK